jgi:hypothetical protein
MMTETMENPFKFGTIVEGNYFTDRISELQEIRVAVSGPNHLILISPRRFGKTSLINKAVKGLDRPTIMINMLQVTGPEDLASRLIRELFKLYPWKKLKYHLSHFRIIPTISTNPLTDGLDISFTPGADSKILLEDAMDLLEKTSSPENRIIVIMDEFQEILNIEKGLDRQLRAIMQNQKNINYIFLGSQESMMEGIFERKKSPFYHFGSLMHLGKIPYEDFHKYLCDGFVSSGCNESEADLIAKDILEITGCHPYYTQQLASKAWEIMVLGTKADDSLTAVAISKIIEAHDLDYERLWQTFNKTDKKVMQQICLGKNPKDNRAMSPSTTASSLKRLASSGYLILGKKPEIEDPFFSRWLASKQN